MQWNTNSCRQNDLHRLRPAKFGVFAAIPADMVCPANPCDSAAIVEDSDFFWSHLFAGCNVPD